MTTILHIFLLAALGLAVVAILGWAVCQIFSFIRFLFPFDDNDAENFR